MHRIHREKPITIVLIIKCLFQNQARLRYATSGRHPKSNPPLLRYVGQASKIKPAFATLRRAGIQNQTRLRYATSGRHPKSKILPPLHQLNKSRFFTDIIKIWVTFKVVVVHKTIGNGLFQMFNCFFFFIHGGVKARRIINHIGVVWT